jgi:hypothetical protein
VEPLPNAGARFYFAFEGEASRGTFVQYGANVDLIFDYAPPPADAALIKATGLDRARTLQAPLGIMVLPIGFTFREEGDSGYRQMRFYQGGTTSDKVRFELRAMDEPSPEQSVKSRSSGDSLDTAPTTGFHVIFDLRSYVLYQFFLPAQLVRILPESEEGMPTSLPLTFDLDQLKQFDDHAVKAQERMAAALQKVLS